MSFTPQSVFDEHEDRLEQLRSVNGSLAADLIEERQQRREVAAALVRVTEERDELTEAIDRLRQRAIEHDERHQKIFAEWLRERAQLIAERDAARDEVVRLGRENDQLRTRNQTLVTWYTGELERLRTIIVELGAGEAAEPEEQIEALRPGDAGFDEWLLGQPGGSE